MITLQDQLRERQLQHVESLIIRAERILTNDYSSEEGGTVLAATARALVVRVADVVENICGKESAYTHQANEYVEWSLSNFNAQVVVIYVSKLLDELKESLQLGSLQSVAEMFHADVFRDYLAMAGHLQESGYKDAAAVIAGSTLESHLRRLSLKHGLAIYKEDGRTYVKADALNGALGKIVYSTFDQKQVTAWLDVRNSAAHGHYDKYSADDARRFIEWLEDFVTRYPA